MKLLVRSALFAGIAVLAVAGTALAGNLHNKVMTVSLPDGLVARVEYQGDVAPKVTVEQRIPELAARWSHATSAPFTMLDRISADMDRQMDVMFRQVRTLDSLPDSEAALVNWASTQAVPAGATRYSYFATSNGKGFCARTVQIISDGAQQKPKVISSTSGDCAAAEGSAAVGKPAVAASHST